MGKNELSNFLLNHCKQRRLSVRSLSVNSGLSPGTVHNIIKRQYQPTIFSLNRLADYIGVKREYLWQLAGLLDDMDYGSETNFRDPRLKFHFARVDNLDEEARNLIISVIEVIINQIEKKPRELSEAGC